MHLQSPEGAISWRSFCQQWWLTFLFLLLICCVCCMQSEPAVLAALVTQCRQLGVDLPKAVMSDQFLCSSARVQVWRSGAGSTGGCGTLVGSLGSEIRLSFSSSSAALLGLCLTSRPCCSLLGLSGHSPLHSCASSQSKHLPWLKNNTVKGGELVCLGYFWAGLVSPLIWLSVAMPRLFWADAVPEGLLVWPQELLVWPVLCWRNPGEATAWEGWTKCATHEWGKKVHWMEKEKNSDHHPHLMSWVWRCSTTSLLLKAKLLFLIYSLLFL